MLFPANATDALIKNKIKLSSYIRKFRVEQLQSHIWGRASYNIWGNAQIFPHIGGGRLSHMTLQLLHSKFPSTVYEENLIFFLISVAGRGGGGHTVLDRSPFEATKWPGQKKGKFDESRKWYKIPAEKPWSKLLMRSSGFRRSCVTWILVFCS